jgi:hypothetical protein
VAEIMCFDAGRCRSLRTFQDNASLARRARAVSPGGIRMKRKEV